MFLLFAYDSYYPSGGGNDFVVAVASIQDATGLVLSDFTHNGQRLTKFDHVHVLNTETGLVTKVLDQ